MNAQVTDGTTCYKFQLYTATEDTETTKKHTPHIDYTNLMIKKSRGLFKVSLS